MRHVLFIWCLLLAGIACFSQSEAFWQSRDSNYNITISGAAPSFQGMGDIVASATWAHGLRAYSTATKGNKLVNVCNDTGGVDVLCADLSSDATSGSLVPASIGGVITCPGNVNCKIKTFYDISGNTGCVTSIVCDVTQATVANRATFVAMGGLWCAAFVRANSVQYNSASNATTIASQPYTMSGVAERNGSVTSSGTIQAVISSTNQILFFNNSANQAAVYSGTTLAATANDNSFHALQGIINGGSSTLYIDGSATNGAGGSGTVSGLVRLGNDGFGDFLDGVYCESGFWSSAFSGGQQSSMNSNQHSYWGF